MFLRFDSLILLSSVQRTILCVGSAATVDQRVVVGRNEKEIEKTVANVVKTSSLPVVVEWKH